MTHDAKISSQPSFLNLSKIPRPRLLLVLGLGVVILLVNFVSGNFGVLGTDSDDLLRFVQVRDYLRGQSWFDTDQYRMGLTAAGTDMHWSRLPDIPIILLTHLFDIFMPQDTALNLAISIWPPLSGLILFTALLIGAEQISFAGDRKYLRVFTVLLAAMFIVGHARFESGAIDHHNLQFGFVALAMVWAMDMEMRASRYFLSGLVTAISIGIGPEVYLFAAVICSFIALNWAVKGDAATRGTQGFGIGLALGMLAIFAATVPPPSYGVIYCDAVSLITVAAAVFGGLGLAITAKTSRYYGGDESLLRRFMALAVLGAICLVALSFQAPQCLANPLNALPQDVTELWLGSISEAAPLFDLTPDWPIFIPTVIGPLLIALCSLIYGYYKQFKSENDIAALWSQDVLVTLLFLTAFSLTIYQIRFSPFAYIFTILILARWTAQSYEKGLRGGGSNVKYILSIALSIPILWAIPGSVLVSSGDAALDGAAKTPKAATANCGSDAIIAALNSLPTGLIAANSNATGPILIHTNHRVISGNYHRNLTGISAEIKLATATPDAAYDLLVDNKIDYVYYCKAQGLKRFIDYNPDGLTARLQAGNIPSFLVSAVDGPLENGEALILKLIPK